MCAAVFEHEVAVGILYDVPNCALVESGVNHVVAKIPFVVLEIRLEVLAFGCSVLESIVTLAHRNNLADESICSVVEFCYKR